MTAGRHWEAMSFTWNQAQAWPHQMRPPGSARNLRATHHHEQYTDPCAVVPTLQLEGAVAFGDRQIHRQQEELESVQVLGGHGWMVKGKQGSVATEDRVPESGFTQEALLPASECCQGCQGD